MIAIGLFNDMYFAERGIVITGPDLTILIDPVLPNDLRQAVIDVLPLWINPILDDPSEIKKRGYQSYSSCLFVECCIRFKTKPFFPNLPQQNGQCPL